MVGGWLADIAGWSRARMTDNYEQLAALLPELELRLQAMQDTKAKLPAQLRLTTFDSLWVVLVAEVVAVATLYELVEDLPTGVAILACIAIGGIETFLGLKFGMSLAALALSGHDSAFALAPRAQRHWRRMAAWTGLCLTALALILGVMRGDSVLTALLWIMIGFGVAALLAAYGAAHYESRPLREHKRATTDYLEMTALAHALLQAIEVIAETAVAHGLRAVAYGLRLDEDASGVFIDDWHANRHTHPVAPPELASMTLPGASEIRQLMVVPFPVALHDGLSSRGLTVTHRLVWLEGSARPQIGVGR